MVAPELGQLCVQIHLARASGLDVDRLIAACESVARGIEDCRGFGSSRGEDEGAFVNLLFATEAPDVSWPLLRAALLESPEFGTTLEQSCMCLCTGADGWADYRLLYHFDPAEPLDVLAGV